MGGWAATDRPPSRWVVSLKRRSVQVAPWTTRWEIDALSQPVKAKPQAGLGALPAIHAVLRDCRVRDGWYMLSDFGQHARGAGLTPDAHGAPGVKKLLAATGHFQIEGDRFRLRPLVRLVRAAE